MARPIEPTPILEGKDAEDFFKELERPKSKKEIKKLRERYKDADKIFKRHFKHLFIY